MSSDAHVTLEPGFRLDRYELLCPIAQGGMAQVWLARLHGKLWRQGRATLQEIARQLDRALEAVAELSPLWSG